MPIPRQSPEDEAFEMREKFFEYARQLPKHQLHILAMRMSFMAWQNGHWRPDTTTWMLIQGAFFEFLVVCNSFFKKVIGL